MKIRTQIKAGGMWKNHNEALKVRSTVKAGARGFDLPTNHNEAFKIRSSVKAGGLEANHNEALKIRSTVKAGGIEANHNEAFRTTTGEQPSNWRQALLALQLICPFCHVDSSHIERSGHHCHCTECQQEWEGLSVSERRFRRSVGSEMEG